MLVLDDSPSPVIQDGFSPAKGNALQACVAALFHQPLPNVPNCIALECQDYLKKNSSYNAIKKQCSDFSDADKGKLCILRGKSHRGSFGHVVIARVDYGVVHDPHKDGTFLDQREAYGWCMLFEKSSITQ